MAFPDLVQTDRALPDADRLAGDVIVPVLEEVTREYDGVNLTLDQLEINLGRVTEEELPSALARALRDELDRRKGPFYLPFLPDDPVVKVEIDATSFPSFGDYTPSPVDNLVAFLSRLEIPWEEDTLSFDPVDLFDRAMESLQEPREDTVSLESFLSRLDPVPFVRLMALARRSERFPDLAEQMERVAGLDAGMSPSPVTAPKDALPPLERASEVKAVLMRRMAARRASWKAYRVYRKDWPANSSLKKQDSPVETVSSGIPLFYTPEASEEEVPGFLRGITHPGPGLVAAPSVPEAGVSSPVPESHLSVPESHLSEPESPSPVAESPLPVQGLSSPQTESPSPVEPVRDRTSERQRKEAAGLIVPAILSVPEREPLDETADQSGGLLSGTMDSDKAEPSLDPGDASGSLETIWEVRPEEEDEKVPERLFLSDAGLVLIHPFIVRFLQNMELVDKKGRFVSRLARVHAVHLLRHVTGFEDEHLAHRLSLEKALCGLPFSYSIPEEWEVTPREKEEAEGMLSALLSYWPSLRKTSVWAFQRGFLQRAGTIGMEDGSLIVRVEGSAMDILMEDLPWEISIILLPWLEKPILVEWQR